MFILRLICLLSSDSSCSICCSSCGVSVHRNMSSAKRRLERHSPSIFTPLFSQFNHLNMLSNIAVNSLGEMVSPCLTLLLIHGYAWIQTWILGQARLSSYCFAWPPLDERPRHWTYLSVVCSSDILEQRNIIKRLWHLFRLAWLVQTTPTCPSMEWRNPLVLSLPL